MGKAFRSLQPRCAYVWLTEVQPHQSCVRDTAGDHAGVDLLNGAGILHFPHHTIGRYHAVSLWYENRSQDIDHQQTCSNTDIL